MEGDGGAMKAIGVAVLLVAASGGVAAQAQTLGELAQKEKERRATTEKAGGKAPRVITQEDLETYAAERPAETAPTTEAAAPADGALGSVSDDSDERARSEKSWRARAESSRGAVQAAERELEAAQSQRNLLGTGPQGGGLWRDGTGRLRPLAGETPPSGHGEPTRPTLAWPARAAASRRRSRPSRGSRKRPAGPASLPAGCAEPPRAIL
jgi:hypothetical protein